MCKKEKSVNTSSVIRRLINEKPDYYKIKDSNNVFKNFHDIRHLNDDVNNQYIKINSTNLDFLNQISQSFEIETSPQKLTKYEND
ncbi:hypothetical protein TRFO_03202 [Tritrichomonas foetus]|uniref:Uncharacterized protein n=1 Tax=Tritrichomonas foetus TaxID=1144522 RepID=A0A1J4KSC0_9EUKA|nr:hypothetical protein TRFO_03202 [Tritrichomonas foetus]|eukprot:OHT14155.1 hypothetical protein TRFO_03202 [Tritrichomonas foetus]